MRWHNVYVAGTGVALPAEVTVETAVADGRYPPKLAERTQQLAVTVAEPGYPAPDFAVGAARAALEVARCAPENVGLLLHAFVAHPGVDLWNPTSYIQQRALIDYVQHHTRTDHCVVSGVYGQCSGALTALELAIPFLLRHESDDPACEPPAALITAADVWPAQFIDRWTSDPDLPFGDGGAAMVISRTPALAQLLSLTTRTEPQFEGLQRGDASFGPCTVDRPIDMRARANQFFRTIPKETMWRRHAAGISAVVHKALDEADLLLTDVTHVAVPFNGQHVLRREYLDHLGFHLADSTWEFGRRIGHMGAGDIIAALHYLLASDRVEPGDHVLALAEGAGFTWTAALLQVL